MYSELSIRSRRTFWIMIFVSNLYISLVYAESHSPSTNAEQEHSFYAYSEHYESVRKYTDTLQALTEDDLYRIRKAIPELPVSSKSLKAIFNMAAGRSNALGESYKSFLDEEDQDFIRNLANDQSYRDDFFRDPSLEIASGLSDEDTNPDPKDIPEAVEERNQTQGWEGCLMDYDMIMLPETLDYEKIMALIANDENPRPPNIPIPEVPPANPVARQIVDSNARRPTGLSQGAFHWIGAAELCVSIGVRYKRNGTGETRQFIGKYVRLDLPTLPRVNYTRVFQLAIGLCAPDTCSDEQIARYVGIENRAMIRYITRGGLLPRNVTYVYSGQHNDFPNDTTAIIVVSIICVIGVIVILATVYDGCFRKSKIQGKIHEEIYKYNKARARSKLTIEGIKEAELYLYDRPTLGDRLETVCAGFSLYSNFARIYSPRPPPPETIPCLNGLRSLTFFWLINAVSFAFGVYLFETWTTHNGLAALRSYLQEWSTMTVISLYYTNASFFFISGFLCVHMFYKNFKANGERITVWFCIRYILHRYWSLAPTLAVSVMIYAWTYTYLADGPIMSPELRDAERCKINWWLAILMWNNLFGLDTPCLPWIYYLCCIWQLALFSLVVLIPLVLLPVAGYIMAGLMYIAHIIAFAIIEKQVYEGEKNWAFDVLQTPWCNAGPWVIGMAFAMLIKVVNRDKKWHWAPITCLWILSITGILFVVYGRWDYIKSPDREWTKAADLTFKVVAPQIMALSVGWITFACWKGYGGAVAKLLEWDVFRSLSQITLTLTLFMGPAMIRNFGNRVSLFYVHPTHMKYLFYSNLIEVFFYANIGAIVFFFPLSKGVFAATQAKTRMDTFLWGRHPQVLDSFTGDPERDLPHLERILKDKESGRPASIFANGHTLDKSKRNSQDSIRVSAIYDSIDITDSSVDYLNSSKNAESMFEDILPDPEITQITEQIFM